MPTTAALVERAAHLLESPYPRGRKDRWDCLLVASGLSAEDIERIFSNTENLYLRFKKATEPLGFDALNRQFYEYAANENGGVEAAMDRFAQRISLTH
jgi:hypothetical protein